ncbi:MAG TPA: LptA/OstA family protein [Hyphomicrobiaceae bacterium]|nr:LptA/OstA family protein [Hyphomicrobiaceae bacterium]
MALVPAPDDTRSLIAMASPGDRAQAFRRARLHSGFVRVLRLALPLCAVGLLASYGLFMQHEIAVETATHKGVLSTGTVTPSFDNFEMANPKYEGYNQKDGSRYMVTAKKAVTDLSPDKPIGLSGIDGTMFQQDGTQTQVAAVDGNFLRTTGRLELFNGVRVRSSNGMRARLSRAIVMTQQGLITSRHPVDVWMPAGHVRGNTMVLKQKIREVVFSEGVAVRLKSQKPAKPTQPTAAIRPKAPTGVVDLTGRSDAPVDVTANELTIKDTQHTALFDGNVRVVQGPATLTSRKLDIEYEGSSIKPAGAAAAPKAPSQKTPSPKASGEPSSKIRYAVATGDVVITREDGTRVITSVARFSAPENLILLEGGVVMTSNPDRKVIGDHAKIHSDTNQMVLTGRQVTLTQGETVLRGSRVDVDRNAGTMKLTRPGASGQRAGRITARFVTPAKPDAKGGDNKAAARQAAGGSGLAFKTDPGAPIDIEAVSMTVEDPIHTATFRGKVVAVQGGFRIETPELIAIYAGSSGLAQGGASPPGATTAGANGAAPTQLTHIKANKSVVITSSDGTKAVGNSAVFDTKSNQVTLVGDVVLTQARQIVRGPKLVIDLATGLSRMETNSGGGGWTSVRSNTGTPKAPIVSTNRDPNACGGRMCAVFYPNELQKPGVAANGGQKRYPPKAKPSIGNGWSATTVAPSN